MCIQLCVSLMVTFHSPFLTSLCALPTCTFYPLTPPSLHAPLTPPLSTPPLTPPSHHLPPLTDPIPSLHPPSSWSSSAALNSHFTWRRNPSWALGDYWQQMCTCFSAAKRFDIKYQWTCTQCCCMTRWVHSISLGLKVYLIVLLIRGVPLCYIIGRLSCYMF